ncbi:MAG: hypothetical protein WC966_04650 [Bradymonadales bacterium]
MKWQRWLMILLMAISMMACQRAKEKASDTEELAQEAKIVQGEAAAMTDEAKTEVLNGKDDAGSVDLTRLNRSEFNRAALYLNVPIFWKYGIDTLEAYNLVTLNFYPKAETKEWVTNEGFSSEFYALYEKMVQSIKNKPMVDPNDKEATRRAKVLEELDQAGLVLLESDFSKSSEVERQFVAKILELGALVDALYARQVGLRAIEGKIPADDSASLSMLRRNWRASAESPKMKGDPLCTALGGVNTAIVDVYPAELQSEENFCDKISAQKNAEELFYQFAVVETDEEGSLRAVPYTERYKEEMTAISKALDEAAEILEKAKTETLLAQYLRAAAQSFLSNNWDGADEAWVAMNASNSSWYVRVAPDETYWEPCSRKAAFHMTFARINPEALTWQAKLTPVQQEMEDAMAKAAGKPYASRKVSFQLPDFIDIIANFADDRDPFGATIGQSLPNWGPVANEGRGRTVAMSNLYTDPESMHDRITLASSFFGEAELELLKDGTGPGLLSTIIHEAAHNLGPSHEYKVNGKIDDEIFGGALATLAEELKAQTAALWYLEFLQSRGIINSNMQNRSYADSIYWAFGHIARGMTTPSGKIQPYSQLAAIQIGILIETGALTFDPDALAANGKDKGRFSMKLDKIPQAVDNMMKQIAAIKARGDKAALEALQQKHIKSKDIPFDIITERMLRLPKTSFVYSIKL